MPSWRMSSAQLAGVRWIPRLRSRLLPPLPYFSVATGRRRTGRAGRSVALAGVAAGPRMRRRGGRIHPINFQSIVIGVGSGPPDNKSRTASAPGCHGSADAQPAALFSVTGCFNADRQRIRQKPTIEHVLLRHLFSDDHRQGGQKTPRPDSPTGPSATSRNAGSSEPEKPPISATTNLSTRSKQREPTQSHALSWRSAQITSNRGQCGDATCGKPRPGQRSPHEFEKA